MNCVLDMIARSEPMRGLETGCEQRAGCGCCVRNALREGTLCGTVLLDSICLHRLGESTASVAWMRGANHVQDAAADYRAGTASGAWLPSAYLLRDAAARHEPQQGLVAGREPPAQPG